MRPGEPRKLAADPAEPTGRISAGDLPPITGIAGGPGYRSGAAGLLGVDTAQAHALAEAADRVGDRLRGLGYAGSSASADPDLLESAVLAPSTFAAAESSIVAATLGPGGLVAESVRFEVEAHVVRAALALISDADQAAHQALETLDYLIGFGLGTGAGLVAGGAARMLALDGAIAASVWSRLPPDERRAVLDQLARLGGGLDEMADDLGLAARGDAAYDWLMDHPGLADHLLNGSGGTLDGLLLGAGLSPLLARLGEGALGRPGTEDASRALGGLYRQPPARITRLRRPPPTQTPRSVADLMRNLDSAYHDPDDGQRADGLLSVQQVRGADGEDRWIVYIPGTDSMSPVPHEGVVRDLGANLRLMGGLETTYEEGIRAALADAGIPAGSDVLLVGHSQGGMVAADIAATDSPYRIEDIVTAGAPLGQVDLPDRVGVTAIDNDGDIVPLLDGEVGDLGPEQVHVNVDDGAHPGFEHDMEHYVRGGAALDASTDPAIRSRLAALSRFLDGSTLSTRGYRISS